MKLLLAAVLFISNLFSMTPSTEAYVLCACYLYQSQSFENIVEINSKPIKFSQGDKVLILSSEGDFIKVKTLSEPVAEGYVYRYYLTDNKPSQDIVPVFNGKVITKDTVVYDLTFNETSIRLDSGQGVCFYNGFNDKEKFTAVQFVQQDGSVYYGYVLTKDVQPFGVSSSLIIGITVIVASVTLILSVIFIKKHHDKKIGREV